MGYTHYWYQPIAKPISEKQWALIAADVKKVLKATTIPLQHEYDEPGTKPTVDAEHI